MRASSKNASYLAVLASVIACSNACVKSPATELATVVFAFDTSESAGLEKTSFARQIRDELMAIPESSTYWVFTFDSDAHEVDSGKPPASQEEAKHIMSKAMGRRSETKGTNLAKLVKLVSQRLKGCKSPVQIRIYTDCGYELMTAEEKRFVEEATARWGTDDGIESVYIVGLRPDTKEEFRKLFQLGQDKLHFEDSR